MEQNTAVEQTATEEKTLTFEELLNSNKDYQKEFDRRMTKGIETAIENKMAELEAQKSEAEKLAKMKDDEKHQYELNKANKERDEAIAELNAIKLEKEAIRIAKEKGLDISLLEDIDYSKQTADTISTIIDTKKEVFDKAIEKAINEKYKENSPKVVLNQTQEKQRVSRSSY